MRNLHARAQIFNSKNHVSMRNNARGIADSRFVLKLAAPSMGLNTFEMVYELPEHRRLINLVEGGCGRHWVPTSCKVNSIADIFLRS